ncbi:hypothetical protein JZ751_003280 [Albula glossodonta]|uniref:catechol O-methyltransferase n=1 Tax=Albula glossodonta TaxID=121402 RepID=A0A8T2NB65_9TELE|nr:hypothetical protein JZ751_003280 [Albula glossodonta]
MWVFFLSACAGGAAVLYVLYSWLIPAAVQYNASLALLWHDVIVERVLDRITGSTRPQRLLRAVQKKATQGDPQSVIATIDHFCRHSEWAMNVQLVEGPSGDLIPQMKELFGVQTFDFVFLDHWKDRYLPDTKLLEECGLLRKGTVLLADNVICPGTPEYLEYIRSSPRYESRYFKSHLEYTKVEDGLEKSVFLG